MKSITNQGEQQFQWNLSAVKVGRGVVMGMLEQEGRVLFIT